MSLIQLVEKHLKPDAPFLKVFPPLWLATLVILVGLDLGTKIIMTETLNFKLAPHQIQNVTVDPSLKALYDGKEKIDLVGEGGNLLKFQLVFNDRFVFGSGPSAPVLGFFLTLFAVIFLFFYRWNNSVMGWSFAWLLVFSGAFGNLIDKAFVKSLTDRSWVFHIGPLEGHVSGVVDFIEAIWFGMDSMRGVWPLGWLAWNTWPTFNLADSYIVVGISILVLSLLFGVYEQEPAREEHPELEIPDESPTDR